MGSGPVASLACAVDPATGISTGGWPVAGVTPPACVVRLAYIKVDGLVVVGLSARDRAAVALRLAGAGFQEIAEVLELADAGQARLAVERGLAVEAGGEGDRERLRLEEERRLMGLLKPLWAKAVDPESPEQVVASRAALAVIDRHARLMGLDAPTEVVVHNPTTVEIDQWVAEVLSLNGQAFGPEGDVLMVEGG